jgi:hypothetical protein
MAALYPGEFRAWTEKFDYITVVFADHFNTAQDELNALLTIVGLTPQIARNDPGSTPFDLQPVVDWIGNAPDDNGHDHDDGDSDLDHICHILDDTCNRRHNYDCNKILDCFDDFWPGWRSH